MARKSIESLYDVLFNMRKNLEDLVQDASGLVNDVNDYGGELGRVVKEQMQKYFIPAVENLTKDENTPGSIIGIIRFMDSLPLAMTRIEPQVEDLAPVEQPEAQIQNPAVEDIPENTSFAQPMPDAMPEAPATPVEENLAESKMKEATSDKFEELEKYCAECLDDWSGPDQGPSNKSFFTLARKVLTACSLKDKNMLKELAYDYANQKSVNPVYDELINFLRDGLKESCGEPIQESRGRKPFFRKPQK